MDQAPREGHGVTILLVDDDESVRYTMRLRLEQMGYACEEADSAPQGIELAKSGRFDLCFLDIRMPGMDGIQALKQLVRVAPHLKVVFLTANTDDGTFERAVTENPSLWGFVMKPIDRAGLERCLETVLRRGGKYLNLG